MTSSTPASLDRFIRTYANSKLTERQGSQTHFNELCAVLAVGAPIETDSSGSWYCFERGVDKTTGRKGWADVWKRGYFAWEYKGPHKDLDAAFAQLQQYAPALENPPLLVTSDLVSFEIHTNWNNTISEKHVLTLEDLRDPENLRKLRAVFEDPGYLRPGRTRTDLTEGVAGEFATIAQRLRDRPLPDGSKPEPLEVAHFVIRLMFCMYAEDAKLLPKDLFTDLLKSLRRNPAESCDALSELFATMRRGGRFGQHRLRHFNGGLFGTSSDRDHPDDVAFALDRDDLDVCIAAAEENWSEIDPSILGTLFVRGLDPSKRDELGAEYTDYDTIKRIVDPVVVRPLLYEWGNVRGAMEGLIEPAQAALTAEIDAASSVPELEEEVREVRSRIIARTQMELFSEAPKQRRVRSIDRLRKGLRAAATALEKARSEADQHYNAFLSRLRSIRVLDPACGSGNFLYVSLAELKSIERRVMIEAEQLGYELGFPKIGPENVYGIEKNAYAAELARVSVWIGEIQWMIRNGFSVGRDPVLRPLEGNIWHRNALVDEDGTKVEWPDAELIVGNPPYKGAKQMKKALGVPETERIRAVFEGRLPGFTDLVCFWFENAREMIERGVTERAGFVATNSIRKNTNLNVMRRIADTTTIYDAWPEEQWVNDGAQVDVSLISFGEPAGQPVRLNGEVVSAINVDLTAGVDLTQAGPLPENAGLAALGIQKSGPFDVPGTVARAWMDELPNTNRRHNSEVLKPYWNGDDLTERPRDVWFIDLPPRLAEGEVEEFASIHEYLASWRDKDGRSLEEVRADLDERAPDRWWEPHWPRYDMRKGIRGLKRYLVTGETSKHHLVTWLRWPTLPDKNLIVFLREDDLMFGLLQNRFHALWALRKGSDLEDRPRYTHTSVTATFPFPEGMTPGVAIAKARAHPKAAAIEEAACELYEAREAWLWPNGSFVEVPEGIDALPETGTNGHPLPKPEHERVFPLRRIPANENAAQQLAKRGLTELYNDPPPWLRTKHKALDAAVAAAYNWKADIEDDDVLEALLDLNTQRRKRAND